MGHTRSNADSAIPARHLEECFWIKSWRPGLNSHLLLLRSVRTQAKVSDVSGCLFLSNKENGNDLSCSLLALKYHDCESHDSKPGSLTHVLLHGLSKVTPSVHTGMGLGVRGDTRLDLQASLLKPRRIEHVLCHSLSCDQRHMSCDWEVRGAGDAEGCQQRSRCGGGLPSPSGSSDGAFCSHVCMSSKSRDCCSQD